jgi:hypothetical protein
MDILSFTTIILMLFIIIGSYLIFTSQIEGNSKIIITVAVFICFVYIFMNLNMFKSYTETKSSPIDASITQTKEKVDTTSTSFSLTTWIYITDWNPGVTKTIFSMTNPVVSTYSPKMILGPYTNDLVITYYTSPSTIDNANWLGLKTALTAYETARDEWVTASNNERDDAGNFYSATDMNGKGITATAGRTTAYVDLSNKTLAAASNVASKRLAYDGGSGTDTVLTPSNKSGTSRVSATYTENNLGKNTTTSYSSSSNALKNYITKNGNSQVALSGDEQNYTLETITIPDISIQKWVNIIVSFGDNTVDTYINGKLVDSHVSTGSVQNVTTTANDTTLTWGTFTGYLSSSRYYPRFLTPQEAWSIYKSGFSDNMLGNFLNQYNAKFTFSQNQVEKASFNIL